MISNNIFLIIFILIIIGIIVYFYYNHNSTYNLSGDHTVALPKTKRVRFNDNVEYKVYKNYSSIDKMSRSDELSRDGSKIDVDSIFSNTDIDINLDDDLNNQCKDAEEDVEENVNPINLETNPEDAWDANFGLLLVSKKAKNASIVKIQKGYREYGNALGKFSKYQTDDSKLVEKNTPIDPFKLNHKSKSLKGRTIKEIYDKQVEGIKAKPKKIKKQTGTSIVYENESEINGGIIKGTKLQGFDGVNNGYKSAAFGNEF